MLISRLRRCSAPGLMALALVLTLSACGRDAVTPESLRGPDNYVPDFTRILPAFRTEWEQNIPGKADAISDYKNAYPEWYQPTSAPSGGFRSMTEWEPMSGVLLGITPGLVSDTPVAQTFVDTVNGSWPVGKVWLLYDGENAKTNFTSMLISNGVPGEVIGDGQQIQFIPMTLDAFWMIDFGPLPIVNDKDEVAFLDWKYYPDRYNDDAMPTKLGELWNTSTYRMPVSFEGGNFQADGMGTCYTTERGVQYSGVSSSQMAHLFEEYVGCTNLVVLKDIHDDGTGHIDMFFKLFAVDGAILGSFTSGQDPVSKQDMDDNEAILEAVPLPTGQDMRVFRSPHPNHAGSGSTPLTFLNSTIMNGVNLWPMYTHNKSIEAEALAVWEEAMPEYTHIGVISDQIAMYSGAIHCVTRTIPDLPLKKWVANTSCGDGVCDGALGGFSGACETTADCFGPEWLCVLEGNCPEPGEDPCQGVTYEGCCDGDTVVWCEDGALSEVNCATNPEAPGPKCGWQGSEGYYWCNAEGAADPSGAFPYACGECEPSCTDKDCGSDGCGGSCGACEDGLSCMSGTCALCEPACDGKFCGDDGCGGTCGSCASGEVCTAAGQCSSDPCGGITYEGCCDGDNVLKWCEEGQVTEVDCSTNPQAPGPLCGWEGTEGYYWCLDNTNPDPSNANPRPCGPCEPECGTAVCGSDGCGGTCGTCGEGQGCFEGACEICESDCSGKQCGDDGCGGSCGVCADGGTCNDADGMCYDDACLGIPEVGCCDDDGVLQYCENAVLKTIDCAQSPQCGWKADANFYDCGTDGAADPSGSFPMTCAPDPCEGKECSADGTCGTCDTGTTCDSHNKCVPCANECNPGENGCLDSNTQSWVCAESTGGCWEKVTTACGSTETCQNGACILLGGCCEGKQCGTCDDGGSCGSCATGMVCTANQCVEGDSDVVGGDDTTDGSDSSGGGNNFGRGGGDDGCSHVSFSGAGMPGAVALSLFLLLSLLWVRRLSY